MGIHFEDPFAGASGAPDPVRRFRGRLGAAVTLWTAGAGPRRRGLTVTSMLVAEGDEPVVVGLIDPLSDLLSELEASRTAVVTILRDDQVRLAEVFAGRFPAPGGPFREGFVSSEWGPVPAGDVDWAGVRLQTVSSAGWSRLVSCRIEQVAVSANADPLIHHRGRYRRLES